MIPADIAIANGAFLAPSLGALLAPIAGCALLATVVGFAVLIAGMLRDERGRRAPEASPKMGPARVLGAIRRPAA